MSGRILSEAASILKTGRNWKIKAQNFETRNGLVKGWQESVNQKTCAKRISLIANGKPERTVTIDGNKVYNTEPNGRSTLIEYGENGKPVSAFSKTGPFVERTTDPLRLWFHSSEALDNNAFMRGCIDKDYGVNKFHAIG